MTKEQEKAINNLKQYIKEDEIYNSERRDLKDFDKFYIRHCEDIEIALDLIEKQDKMIDKLTEAMENEHCSIKNIVNEVICDHKRCIGNAIQCRDCIKEYFERKVENKYE